MFNGAAPRFGDNPRLNFTLESLGVTGAAAVGSLAVAGAATVGSLSVGGVPVNLAQGGVAGWPFPGAVAFMAAKPFLNLGRIVGGAVNSFVPTIGNLEYFPFLLHHTTSIDRIAFVVSVGGGAGSVARVGIYNSDPVTFGPTSLVIDGGEFDTTLVQENITVIAPTTLTGGVLYWIALNSGVSAPTVGGISPSDIWSPLGAAAGLLSGNPCTRLRLASAYGALPVNFPAGGGSRLLGTTVPSVWVRPV